MKKLKKKLIHLFGGYTKEEYIRHAEIVQMNTEQKSCEKTLSIIKSYMKSIDNLPANKWRKEVYEYVTVNLESYE